MMKKFNQLLMLTEKVIRADAPDVYLAENVTFAGQGGQSIRVDLVEFQPRDCSTAGTEKGLLCCYKVITSVDDFGNGQEDNFIGDYNYVVMPNEVFLAVKDYIPRWVGVYVWDPYINNGVPHKIIRARRRFCARTSAEILQVMTQAQKKSGYLYRIMCSV